MSVVKNVIQSVMLITVPFPFVSEAVAMLRRRVMNRSA